MRLSNNFTSRDHRIVHYSAVWPRECWKNTFKNILSSMYQPAFQPRTECDAWSILSGVWIQFYFFYTGCYKKVKDFSLLICLPIAGERIVGRIYFPRICDMQKKKNKQRSEFELGSTFPYPTKITTTPGAPLLNIYFIFQLHPMFYLEVRWIMSEKWESKQMAHSFLVAKNKLLYWRACAFHENKILK